MTYSEVVKKGWILPYKSKYTMRDVNSVLCDSLFANEKTLSEKEAKFIVNCAAVYHDSDISDSLLGLTTNH